MESASKVDTKRERPHSLRQRQFSPIATNTLPALGFSEVPRSTDCLLLTILLGADGDVPFMPPIAWCDMADWRFAWPLDQATSPHSGLLFDFETFCHAKIENPTVSPFCFRR